MSFYFTTSNVSEYNVHYYYREKNLDSNDEFRSGDFIELCDEPYVDADGYSSGDSSESSDEDGTQARPPCKVSTYKPLVNSLDK